MIKKMIPPIFLVFLLLNSVVAESPKAFYSLIINYDAEKISLQEVKLVEGSQPNFPQKGEFSITLISFKGESLFSYKFDIPLVRAEDAPLEWFDKEGKQVVIPKSKKSNIISDKASKNLFVPYFFNGKMIVIKEGDEVKLTIDVSHFSQCNEDTVCDKKESVEMCPSDCSANFSEVNVSFWQWLINLIKSIFS